MDGRGTKVGLDERASVDGQKRAWLSEKVEKGKQAGSQW